METASPTAVRPRAAIIAGRRVAVEEVMDMWLIEDEWWRAPIARLYLQVLLAGGRMETLFHDRIGGGWYLQRYSGARGR